MNRPPRGHPPAWTYLFRSGTAFDAHTRADDELVDGAARQGERHVLLRSRASRADLGSVERFHGAVLIAPNGVTERHLASAGFAFVRRYALLPSPAQPRWVIPLRPASHGVAALRALATPYRPRGRMLAAAAALLIRAHVPLAGREVLIASRERPPVESEIERLLGLTPASIGLVSGGWGLRHTPTFVALSPKGEALAFVKLAGSERSRRLITREAQVLEAFASNPALRDLAPRLLYAGLLDGHYANVQTPLAGSPGPAHLGTAHRRFLLRLEGAPRDAASSEMLLSIDERLAMGGSDARWLARLIAATRDRLRGVRLPRTLVHGDFAPFNLRIRDGILAGFDWENSALDGLPTVDALHHELQVGFLLHDWSVARAARALDRARDDRNGYGLYGVQVRALQAVYLMDMYLRRIEGGHGASSELTTRYAALLRHVQAELAA